MKRVHSRTFDSNDNLINNLARPRNRLKEKALLDNIRLVTLAVLQKGNNKLKRPTQEIQEQTNSINKLTMSIHRAIALTLKNSCEICEMIILPNDSVAISECGHLFCTSCATSYVTYKINAFEDVLCPKEGCEKAINQNSELFHGLAIELKKKFKKHQIFNLTQKDPTKKPCQKPDCQGIVEIVDKTAICNECHSLYCHLCLYEKHEGECSNFQVEFLQNNYQYRQCSKCKNVIQKSYGCNHITCKCGHQFCYMCGSDWNQDPCRFPNTARPAPQTHTTCSSILVWTLKILLIPLWSILGIFLALIIYLFIVSFFLLISIFAGPCKYLREFMDCSSWVDFIVIIFMPVLYVLLIPVYFGSRYRELFDNLVACYGFYCEVLRRLLDW